jgi:hypothetical protein
LTDSTERRAVIFQMAYVFEAKLTEPLPEGQKPEIHPGWRLKTEDRK